MVKDLLAAVGVVAIGLGVYVAIENHNRKQKLKEIDESFMYRGDNQIIPTCEVIVELDNNQCESLFPQAMVSDVSPLPYGQAINGWWTDERYNYHGTRKND